MSVSPAVRPPPGNPRFPLFDGMRAVAILIVLGAHVCGMTRAIPASWGWLPTNALVAVALFFAVSAFLLYRPFASAHAGLRRAPGVRSFTRRRVLRIVPAYWVALTLLAVFPGVAGAFSGRWWIYYGFVQIYSSKTLGNGVPVAWSVCVEATFYLVLPALAALVTVLTTRWSARPWWHAQIVLIGTFAAIGPCGRGLAQAHELPQWTANTLVAMTDWFAAGMGLAVVSVELERRGRALHRTTVLAGWPAWMAAAVVFVLAARVFDPYRYLFHRGAPEPSPFVAVSNHVLLGISAALFLMPAVFGASRAIGRLLSCRPVAYVGLVSYGIYLWHYPLAAWLADWHGPPDPIPGAAGGGLAVQGIFAGHARTLVLFVATLALSLAVASASYRWVELPFLRRKERTRRPSTPRVPAIDGSERASVAGASPSGAPVEMTADSSRAT